MMEIEKQDDARRKRREEARRLHASFGPYVKRYHVKEFAVALLEDDGATVETAMQTLEKASGTEGDRRAYQRIALVLCKGTAVEKLKDPKVRTEFLSDLILGANEVTVSQIEGEAQGSLEAWEASVEKLAKAA